MAKHKSFLELDRFSKFWAMRYLLWPEKQARLEGSS
ncbi:hypothetical protein CCACVL1_07349 [Corchorus capsularis]|uniref:Uncharacterized protein n=1 Tax=Corchorus capsularis TaxID=210143 RepID=A0A1R3J6Q2_COCAP|nr:hypothetical protein CCACVL1_07349 [Corchorus capsularis]